jgi:HEAT repeat protein
VLREKAPADRVEALKALSAFGPKAKSASAALLDVVLYDKSEEVRQAAAECLERIGLDDEIAIPKFAHALNDLNPGTAQAAAGLLKGISERPKRIKLSSAAKAKVIPALFKALKSARDSAGPTLDKIDVGPADKRLVPALIDVLNKDGDDYVRSTAVCILGKMGPEAREAIPVLVGILEKAPWQSSKLHEATVGTLGKMGPVAKGAVRAMTTALVQALKTRDRKYRDMVIAALAQVEPEAKAAPALIEALKDKDKTTRLQAIEALAIIGPEAERAVSALAKTLDDKDEAIRHAAVKALGQLGSEAEAAVPALT